MIGRVVRAVVAPTKHPGLAGCKLLLVAVESGPDVLAVDTVGAGVGSEVIVVTGSHALRITRPSAPVDAVIVGLLESDNG